MTEREFTCRMPGDKEWDEPWRPIEDCLYCDDLEYKFRTKPVLEPGFYKSNTRCLTDYYALLPDGQWVWLPSEAKVHGATDPEYLDIPAMPLSELIPWTKEY